jgi:hypothetical protein
VERKESRGGKKYVREEKLLLVYPKSTQNVFKQRFFFAFVVCIFPFSLFSPPNIQNARAVCAERERKKKYSFIL